MRRRMSRRGIRAFGHEGDEPGVCVTGRGLGNREVECSVGSRRTRRIRVDGDVIVGPRPVHDNSRMQRRGRSDRIAGLTRRTHARRALAPRRFPVRHGDVDRFAVAARDHPPFLRRGDVAEHRMAAAVEESGGQDHVSGQRAVGDGIDALEDTAPLPRVEEMANPPSGEAERLELGLRDDPELGVDEALKVVEVDVGHTAHRAMLVRLRCRQKRGYPRCLWITAKLWITRPVRLFGCCSYQKGARAAEPPATSARPAG